MLFSKGKQQQEIGQEFQLLAERKFDLLERQIGRYLLIIQPLCFGVIGLVVVGLYLLIVGPVIRLSLDYQISLQLGLLLTSGVSFSVIVKRFAGLEEGGVLKEVSQLAEKSLTAGESIAEFVTNVIFAVFVQFLLPEFTNMGMALPTLVGLPVVLSIVAVTLIGIAVTGIVWWRRHSWLQKLVVLRRLPLEGRHFYQLVTPYVRSEIRRELAFAVVHGNLMEILAEIGSRERRRMRQIQKLRQLLMYPIVLFGLLARVMHWQKGWLIGMQSKRWSKPAQVDFFETLAQLISVGYDLEKALVSLQSLLPKLRPDLQVIVAGLRRKLWLKQL
ncbi:hypothetical protein H7R52_13150 [Weissella confusa]|uniref:Uncharacterized protein n=1 Tax=Weissella confusa TaxID=1583 RepID=A0A923STV7_WEICO|nr:hypothetical protein [Weissella confusa]